MAESEQGQRLLGGSSNALVVVLVALIAALIGALVGWATTRQLSPEWVGAIGQWVGGLGTIATLIWAVLEFRRREDEKARAHRAKMSALEKAATDVTCGVKPSSYKGNNVLKYTISEWNSTADPVLIRSLQIEGQEKLEEKLLVPEWQSQKIKLNELIEGFSRRSTNDDFRKRFPVAMVYEINGQPWRRIGHGKPEML